MAVSKGTSPGASAILIIPFMSASSHDGLVLGIYQDPNIPKQVTFQDSALLSGLWKINKKLKSLDNDLDTMRAEKKDPEENINHQEDKSLEIEIGLETILDIGLEIHKTETEGCQEVLISLEINLETIQMIDQMIEPEMVVMILNKNPTDFANIVIKMVILENIVGRYKPVIRK